MKKKYLKILAIVITVAMVAMMVAACAADDPAPVTPDPDPATPEVTPDPTPEPEGDAPVLEAPEETAQDTITFLTGSLAVHVRPWGQNDSASAMARKQMFDTLFTLDYNTFEVVPELSLASAWEQVDARTTNITIREGVVFHNGEIMTAHDVAFSLEQSAQSGAVEIISGMIDHVEVHDDLNLTVHTEIDFAPIINHLAHTSIGIVPQAYFEEVGEDGFEAHPIGSGPFMFEEWILGDRMVFSRNADYWGIVPAVETLIFREVADASVRLMEVIAGTADVADAILPVDVPMAEADPNVTLHRRMNLSTNYIGFNVERPHISNPLVRQAINYALDTTAIVEHVFMGLGAPISSPVAPIVWGFEEQPPFATDMDRARELLEEAGYNPTPGEDGGFSTSIWWNIPNAQRSEIAEMVQFTLAQLNIDVSIESMEWAQYLADTAEGLHDMFILGWVSVTGDIDYGLYPLFHSSNFGDPGNRTFWYTPELDALLEEGRSETNPARRLEIYAEAQAIIRAEAPWVFLNQGEFAVATSANMNGFVLNPAGHHSFAPAWFD